MNTISAITAIFFLILTTLSYSVNAQGTGCAAGYDCSERGVGIPGEDTCGNGEWESMLVSQESGGDYSVEYSAAGALGRYQFVNGTRQTIGSSNSLPCSGSGDREGFRSCPGLQDDYFRALTTENVGMMTSTCDQYCGNTHECPVTMSGLAAIAHNVGPACAKAFARGGYAEMQRQEPLRGTGQSVGCTDANGTNAAEKYGCAMGGFDMGSYGGEGGMEGCGFGFTPGPAVAPYQGHLLGCDPAVLDQGNAIIDAMNERDVQTAQAMIKRPTPIEQSTCLDQHIQLNSAANSIHANPGGNGSSSMSQLVEKPTMKWITQNFMSGNLAGSLQSMVNNSFGKIVGEFNKALGDLKGGLGGLLGGAGGANTNCDMMNQSWLLSQCLKIPKIPSLKQMMTGAIDKITGGIITKVKNVINAPFKALEKVCEKMSGKLGDFAGNIQGTMDSATDAIAQPINDTLQE